MIVTTSLDDRYPAHQMLDGNDNTFWISTGLYPQEIILKTNPEGCALKSLKTVSTNIKSLKVDATIDPEPVNFQPLVVPTSLERKDGRLQSKDFTVNTENTRYLRLTILEGYHDFTTVHKVEVA